MITFRLETFDLELAEMLIRWREWLRFMGQKYKKKDYIMSGKTVSFSVRRRRWQSFGSFIAAPFGETEFMYNLVVGVHLI